MRSRPLTIFATLAALSFLAGCGNDSGDAAGTPTKAASQATEESAAAAGSGDCRYQTQGEAAKEVNQPAAVPTASGPVQATIKTSAGDLIATLDADRAPCTVNSFVSLAEQDYFNDTSCHRLTLADAGIAVLQCGDPTGSGMGGPGYTIPDELKGDETYPAGTLAMAKTEYPDSGGSQFFVVYGNTPLPPDYTVFGQIDEASIAVVSKVADNGTSTGASDGPPATPVDIKSVSVG